MRLRAFRSGWAELDGLLGKHPAFELLDEARAGVFFLQGEWERRVLIGRAALEGGDLADGVAREGEVVRGLVELMDNNPLVCTDSSGVPSAGATLALLALGPLVRAGLLLEDPVAIFNFEVDAEEVEGFVREAGWGGGVVSVLDEVETEGVGAAVVMGEVPLLEDWSELDGLYEEAYGRSFFVRRAEEGDWDTRLVRGYDHAVYRLRLSPGEERAVLTVQTMGDFGGKLGAGQVVHVMNVMAGLEEGLGLRGAG